MKRKKVNKILGGRRGGEADPITVHAWPSDMPADPWIASAGTGTGNYGATIHEAVARALEDLAKSWREDDNQ